MKGSEKKILYEREREKQKLRFLEIIKYATWREMKVGPWGSCHNADSVADRFE